MRTDYGLPWRWQHDDYGLPRRWQHDDYRLPWARMGHHGTFRADDNDQFYLTGKVEVTDLDLTEFGLTFISIGDPAATRRAKPHAVWQVRYTPPDLGPAGVEMDWRLIDQFFGYLVPDDAARRIIYEVQERRWRGLKAPDPAAAAEAAIAAGVLLPPGRVQHEWAGRLAHALREAGLDELALLVERELQVRWWRDHFQVGRRDALRIFAAGVRIGLIERLGAAVGKLRAAGLDDLADALVDRAALAALAG